MSIAAGPFPVGLSIVRSMRPGAPRSVIWTIYSGALFGNSTDRWSMKTRTEGRRPRRWGKSAVIVESESPASQAEWLRGLPGCRTLRRGLPPQRVFVDLAAFHDHGKARLGPCEKREICDRIAVHDQKVGKRALFHDSQLSGVGVARSRQGEQLPVGRRRHPQNLRVVVPT